jgi:hypothetical protein
VKHRHRRSARVVWDKLMVRISSSSVNGYTLPNAAD